MWTVLTFSKCSFFFSYWSISRSLFFTLSCFPPFFQVNLWFTHFFLLKLNHFCKCRDSVTWLLRFSSLKRNYHYSCVLDFLQKCLYPMGGLLTYHICLANEFFKVSETNWYKIYDSSTWRKMFSKWPWMDTTWNCRLDYISLCRVTCEENICNHATEPWKCT